MHPDSPATSAPASPSGGGELKASQALRKARELITPEGAWAKFEFAYDDDYHKVEFDSLSATCWCASGAINKINETDDVTSKAHCFLERCIGQCIPTFNDAPGRTHAEVLDAFRRAEALALSEGC